MSSAPAPPERAVFGGPLNDQTACIHPDRTTMVALAETPRSLTGGDHPDPGGTPRMVRYQLTRFACRGVQPPWVGECWVGEGYPEERILQALEGIAGMARLLTLCDRPRAAWSPQDYCGLCRRRILDDDPEGCEDEAGQRWCQIHHVR